MYVAHALLRTPRHESARGCSTRFVQGFRYRNVQHLTLFDVRMFFVGCVFLHDTTLHQGYFTIAGGYTPPRPVKKAKGKRGRDSDDEDGGDNSDGGLAEGREVVGGSEPRRRVR